MMRLWFAIALVCVLAGQGLTAPRDLPAGADFWDGRIETQADMVQPVTIRFDDMGSKPDIDVMAREFLLRGIKVTIGLNADNCSDNASEHASDGGVSDFQQLRNIKEYANQRFPFPRTQGAERPPIFTVPGDAKDMVEFYQHTNTSMTPSLYGYSNSNQWPEFFKFTMADWRNELDKESMLEVLAQTGWSDVTAADIRGGVWPGDATPRDRSFVHRNLALLRPILQDLGYDYFVTGGETGADSSFAGMRIPTASGGVAENSALSWGYFNKWPEPFYLPMPSTFDLTNSKFVERDPNAPWAPEGTVEWRAGDKIPQPGGFTSSADSPEGNWIKSFRGIVQQQMANGGGVYIVLHSVIDTHAGEFAFDYPAAQAANNDELTTATIGKWLDVAYMAAVIKEYIDAGYLRSTTMSEHVNWLAKKPAPGLVVAGGPPVFSWLEIGDTLGMQPRILHNYGSVGMGNTSLNSQNPGTLANTVLNDDFDSDLLEHEYGTGASDEFYHFVSDYVEGGKAAMLASDRSGGTGDPRIYFSSPVLPGRYRLEAIFQNTHDLQVSIGGIWRGAYVEDDFDVEGYPEWSFYTDQVDTLIAAGTNWDRPVHATAWEDTSWPDGEPGASEDNWWHWNYDFIVDPANYPDLVADTRETPLIERYFMLMGLWFLDDLTNAGEPRIHAVRLRYLGDL